MNNYKFYVIDDEESTYEEVCLWDGNDYYLLYCNYKNGGSGDKNISYIRNNLQKINDGFIIDCNYLNIFKEISNMMNKIWGHSWLLSSEEERLNKRVDKLQNQFLISVKSIVDKNEMKEVINLNCGVNKVKRKKRVM